MKYTQEIKDDTVITTHELDVSSKDKIKKLVDSKQLPPDFESLESISLEKAIEIFGKYGIEFK